MCVMGFTGTAVNVQQHISAQNCVLQQSIPLFVAALVETQNKANLSKKTFDTCTLLLRYTLAHSYEVKLRAVVEVLEIDEIIHRDDIKKRQTNTTFLPEIPDKQQWLHPAY